MLRYVTLCYAIPQKSWDCFLQVGPTYGRRMMKGFIIDKFGCNISQHRINNALKEVAPTHHAMRTNGTAAKVNPIPYRADYFGHKLHLDQNEKLALYGVTHVCAIDGHSRYIVAGTSMPVKNNLVIFEQVFKLVLSFLHF